MFILQKNNYSIKMGEISLDQRENISENFPQENAKQNEKVFGTKCGVHSTHTTVTINKRQIKTPKIHKTRQYIFHIRFLLKNKIGVTSFTCAKQ